MTSECVERREQAVAIYVGGPVCVSHVGLADSAAAVAEIHMDDVRAVFWTWPHAAAAAGAGAGGPTGVVAVTTSRLCVCVCV